MRILTTQDMRQVFSMRDAFDAQREAFRIYTAGGAAVPLRSSVDVSGQEAQVLFMPAIAEEAGALGVKIVGFFPHNPAQGRPVTPATMVLLDPGSGEVVCLMDGTYLTQLRTAAAAGLATELLAVKGARTAALIGLGGQGPCQFDALLEAAPTLEEVRVYDLDEAKRVDFAAQRTRRGLLVVPAASAEAAVSGAQIVTTVTTARQPLFSAEAVGPGTHVNAIGSYTPEMQELPEALVAGCDLLVFDTVHGVLSESGDILKPRARGLLEGKRLDLEMGHLIAGLCGRASAQDITVYKGVGSGVMDVVTARRIFERAERAGVGGSVGG
ncbi:MAG: ornithine cyclodeaminase family protein [Clostridiales bacterium]|nr:ornithine cyclodeaminase family protein [Clostridiales bacterium]